VPFYKHCGNAGQAKCGRNLARRLRSHIKHAFEIVAARQSAIVNFLHLPQRSRDFAPERPAIRRSSLFVSSRSGSKQA
jgi:hypothetical protein